MQEEVCEGVRDKVADRYAYAFENDLHYWHKVEKKPVSDEVVHVPLHMSCLYTSGMMYCAVDTKQFYMDETVMVSGNAGFLKMFCKATLDFVKIKFFILYCFNSPWNI